MNFDFAIAPVDAVVLILYLICVVLFGIWVGGGQRDVAGYLLGGRNVPWWALLGSIVATETSTATFLSVPGLAFAERIPGLSTLDPRVGGNLGFLQLAFGMLVGRCLIVYFLLPLFFRGELFTAYEVLHHRFGGATQKVASLVFLVARNVGDGLRLFLTALVLERMIGGSLSLCVVIVGLITIVYTFLGGIKSVIWTDCIQLVVYVVGGGLLVGFILSRIPGGWSEFWAFAESTGKLQIVDTSADLQLRFTFWSGLIGGACLSLGTHGTDQMMVQRYLCARSQREAGWALMCSGVVVLLQFLLFLMLGVALACFYAHVRPDVRFDTSDRVLSTFIVTELPAGLGLVGVMLAAIFSVAMSTLSSSLNSSASAAVNDFYRSGWKQELSDRHLLWASRAATVVFGFIQIGIGLAAHLFTDVVINNVLAIAGFTAGVLLGLFALGVLTRRVGQRAALVGLVAGVVVLAYVKFDTAVAYTWYALIGGLVTFGVGVLVSFLEPRATAAGQGDQAGPCRASLDDG
ncbi:MAG: sodium:solute symporter family transporter [Pirellulaceae bacterium]